MRLPRRGAMLGRTRTTGTSRNGGASGVSPPTRRPRSSISPVAGRKAIASTCTGRLK